MDFLRTQGKCRGFLGSHNKTFILVVGSISVVVQYNRMASHLVWVDLEMTGLDINNDTILEMACIITDSNLNIIAEGPDLCIHHTDDALNNMNEWCRINHAKSGLTARVKASTHTLENVEQVMLDFVKQHISQARISPLAGNSVHVDKKFLDKYQPKNKYKYHFSKAIVDVSTVKELCRRWHPEQFAKAPPKAGKHRALEDIQESIEELQYYKTAVFK